VEEPPDPVDPPVVPEPLDPLDPPVVPALPLESPALPVEEPPVLPLDPAEPPLPVESEPHAPPIHSGNVERAIAVQAATRFIIPIFGILHRSAMGR